MEKLIKYIAEIIMSLVFATLSLLINGYLIYISYKSVAEIMNWVEIPLLAFYYILLILCILVLFIKSIISIVKTNEKITKF